MGLESASYISQLVTTNPTGSDQKSSMDDHVRLVKTVLQSQFPSLGASPVTLTAAELNSSVVAALAAASAAGATVFSGTTAYAQYAAVISPVNLQTYRRNTAGTNATDPSSDSTNWTAITTGSAAVLTSINGGAVSGPKEKIINGRMEIDQRNGGASVNPAAATTTYLVDRFCTYVSQTSKLSFQQVTDGPSGFKNSLKVTVSAQYSPSSGEQFILWQPIEGLNCIDLALGTASASQITARVYAKSSVPGTYACWLTNSAANRTYVGTITLGTTWALNTILLTGDTTGTWATDNGQGLLFGIDLGSGTSLQTSAGAWQAGSFRRTSGSVTFVNQAAGSTLNITGVSLKAGDCRNELYNEWRPYAMEFALCQRYLPAFNSTSTISPVCDAFANSTTNALCSYKFKVKPRVPPTGITATAGNTFVFSNTANYTGSAISFGAASTELCMFSLTVSGATSLTPGYIYCNSTTGQILFTGCEL